MEDISTSTGWLLFLPPLHLFKMTVILTLSSLLLAGLTLACPGPISLGTDLTVLVHNDLYGKPCEPFRPLSTLTLILYPCQSSQASTLQEINPSSSLPPHKPSPPPNPPVPNSVNPFGPLKPMISSLTSRIKTTISLPSTGPKEDVSISPRQDWDRRRNPVTRVKSTR